MVNVGNGVCPNEFVEKIIWSPTESGQVNRKLCPEPLTGRITPTHVLMHMFLIQE